MNNGSEYKDIGSENSENAGDLPDTESTELGDAADLADEAIPSPEECDGKASDDQAVTVEEAEESAVQNDNTQKPKSFTDLLKGILEYFEPLAIALGITLLVFTFCCRHCVVDGRSMNKTLYNGEVLITTNLFYEPSHGDIIVFHLINNNYQHPLVKRMIADEGQEVKIDLTANQVFVDGVLLEEDYVFLDSGSYTRFGYFNDKNIYIDNQGHTVYRVTVPEGHIFVMGDNRNHSTDSRSEYVGFVDKDCILGKAFLRLKPFTFLD